MNHLVKPKLPPKPTISAPKRLYFVVRVSKLDANDAIDELDAVIAKFGHAWFGKFGRPMGTPATKSAVDARLIVMQSEGGVRTTYRLKSYAVKGFSRNCPKDKTYPAYYGGFLNRIRTWVQIEQVWGENLTIADLTVASSLQPLSAALRGSMSSHFICWKRN